ncbi:GIY-YIG nuclease family protein [Dyadobacter sp. 32]|uniref:GIY-YIG nuclease family protein n=1 Tax=Dyadobacter sp. 32 TaxID=538966 RepID=UPI0011EF6AE1
MKSNSERRKEIFTNAIPPVGTKEYLTAVENLKRIEKNDPRFNEFVKKSREKVINSLEAQYLSHCGLVTEKSLRHFLKEFNSRAWNHGLRSMPVMFNILEAFFNYVKPEMYFELIEEENYLISFFEFIDFVTSNDFADNKNLIEENLTSDIIYNFNVGKDLDEITFKTEDGDEFIVAGVSILRRDNEVTILMTTGKRETTDSSENEIEFEFSTDNPNKRALVEEMKERLKNEGNEFEYLDPDKKYIRVLVAGRIDLDTSTIDARYIAEESNLSFRVVTDEIDSFVNNKGEFYSDSMKEAFELSRKEVDNFGAIVELMKFSLYLPYFFNLHEESIVEEVLDTEFKKHYSSPLTKRKYKDTFGAKGSTKSLYSIDKSNIFSPDTIKLRDDLFKIQTSGYWKNLDLEEIGQDKKGNTIHGRTWVHQNLSWFEAKEKDLIVEKAADLFIGENAGFIYIMRNPTMTKNIFKIGLTRNEVDDRANQLSKTSVPDKFYKSQEWNVKNCVTAEKEIHIRLNQYRVDPRREFFNIEYDKAIKVIMEVIDEINQ